MKKQVLILDLDDTVVDTSPRKIRSTRILEGEIGLRLGPDEEIERGYGIVDYLKSLDPQPCAFCRKYLIKRWLEIFFSPLSLSTDPYWGFAKERPFWARFIWHQDRRWIGASKYFILTSRSRSMRSWLTKDEMWFIRYGLFGHRPCLIDFPGFAGNPEWKARWIRRIYLIYGLVLRREIFFYDDSLENIKASLTISPKVRHFWVNRLTGEAIEQVWEKPRKEALE